MQVAAISNRARPGHSREPEPMPLVCYHEAGHALLAYLVGRRIHSVTISGREGMTRSIPRRDETVYERVAVHLAGATAEHIGTESPAWPPHFADCAEDARNAEAAIVEHLRATPGADGAFIWARSLSESRRVLQEHRHTLQRVAEHLHRFGHASHFDILHLTIPRA